ncbi:hypothetical protein EZ313_08880 [Ramlibacter henchirensis]|uniref:Uncharacterized protein n=1 Tax=Ramlibacter henchirensis TaxID=204072 RepID=A0A4Z0C8G8_9BURK|nr:hypothetical protein [Ramlibacter henchirensis]TFZ06720.1 hypothetical protein EZ313_08880 [Ramlibacter henchirensis]
MTQFVHVDYPTQHSGVERIERAAGALKDIASRFDGARGAATLLLAAVVSALLVVANQVVDTWTEGHLLAAWIVLWTVAFAALALLAAPARRVVLGFSAKVKAFAAARRQAAEDRRFWDVAVTDARVMADLSRAMSSDAARDVRSYY